MDFTDRHRKPTRRVRRTLLSVAVAAYAALLGTVAVNASNYRHNHRAFYEQASDQVLICTSSGAYAYHSHRCQGLNRCKANIKTISKSQAQRLRYRPCGYCYR